jgi:UDP-GlcNAc:undecaprenyl-phosphate GlcNAc-1-phosphate transferase
MEWWHIYLVAWAGTTVLGGLFTWGCRAVAPRWGFVDTPLNEAHKRHRKVTPVLGGLGMLLGWLAALGGGLVAVSVVGDALGVGIRGDLVGVPARLHQLGTIAAGAVALTAVGMIDDRVALRASRKFAAQILVAVATAAMGVRITAFAPAPWLAWVLTVLWIVGIINATNFLDNMDGLAGGIAAIAAFFFLCTAAFRGQHFVAVLAAVTCGSACGFLLHNRPPASIFMGDGGSHFLGYLLAVLGALTTFYLPGESLTPAPVLMPLLILGLPIFDAAAVVFLRLRQGRPIYIGDNTHISHRFAWLGLSRPKAVLLACLLALTTGCGAMALLWLPPAGVLIVLIQAAATFAIVSVIQFCSPEARGH